jgi:hypothetical protein
VTGPPPTPPPKWKTAIVTLVAVFPPVLFFNVTVIPYLGGISVVLRTLALCVGVTAAVTWVMMPRIMPLVRNWLNAPKAAPPEDSPPSRGGRRRRGGDFDDEDRTPAWLLEPTTPVERDAGPDSWYEPREPAPRRRAQEWDDEPAPYPEGNRRAPWYGRQQPWYGRPDEDNYPTEVIRRDDYREDDYYEQPARYDRYDEPEWAPARDRGPGTGGYRR